MTVGLLPLTGGNTRFSGNHFGANRLRHVVRRERRGSKSSVVTQKLKRRSQFAVICLPNAFRFALESD